MSALPDKEQQVEAVKRGKLGAALPEQYIYFYVESLHNAQDFLKDTIAGRIKQFSKYRLTLLPIQKVHFNYEPNKNKANAFKEEFLKKGSYPPIVVGSNLSVIDGTHRVEGLRLAGETEIRAWVGEI